MTELEKEAEVFVSEKADKGNFDVEKFGRAYFSESSMKQALVKFAEPREKQIQIDAEQIRALQKQNGELTDELKALRESVKNYGAGCYENGLRNGKRKLEQQMIKEELEQAEKVKVVEHFEAYGQCRDSRRIAELEAQVEKMKCCENCAFQLVIDGVRGSHCVKCNACSEWELED